MKDESTKHVVDRLQKEPIASSEMQGADSMRIASLLEENRIRANELVLANKELAYQNAEKEKRAAELVIANKELAYQNDEKEKRAAELVIANKELAYQNDEKEKRAAELIEAQNLLFHEKTLLKNTIACIGDGVVSIDITYSVVLLNGVAESLTGWTLGEALGKPLYEIFNIMNEFTRKMDGDIAHDVITSGTIQKLANHTILIRKDGKELLIEDSAAPVFDISGRVVGAVIVFRDYTEKWEHLKRIEYLSLHDELTGLFNRRFFEIELKRLDTKRNLPLSLIMGDINGLKLVNDSFGHETGDELLKKAADAISRACRSDEIVARLGGDEFIILLPHTGAAESERVADRIREFVDMEKVRGLSISISCGVHTKTQEQEDMRDIFKKTEDQMYRRKILASGSMRSATISMISTTLFEKNERELIHSGHVGALCFELAGKMNFSIEDAKTMRLAGLMHDIGKIGTPESILNSSGTLSDEQYNEVKKHPEIGYRILSSVIEFSEISRYVLEHHEKWDGTGYPQSLKGEAICVEARMIAVADSYDAMTSQRTYRKVLSREEAIIEIMRCSGTQFDPAIAKVFVEQVIPNYRQAHP